MAIRNVEMGNHNKTVHFNQKSRKSCLTNEINNGNRIIGIRSVPIMTLSKPRLTEMKGGHVGCHNRSVHHQEKNEPIPNSFEGRVVKNGPFVDSRGLETVFG